MDWYSQCQLVRNALSFRRVLGSMDDLAFQASVHITRGDKLLAISRRLAPYGPIELIQRVDTLIFCVNLRLRFVTSHR
jgi:hypothetical protein